MTKTLERLARELASGDLVEVLDDDGYPIQRSVCALACLELELRGAEAIPVLEAALASDVAIDEPNKRTTSVAAKAAWSLAKLGASHVLPQVVELWFRTRADLRGQLLEAVLALCQRSQPAAISSALIALTETPDTFEKRILAKRMARFGGAAYEAACILASDHDNHVRLAAKRVLAEIERGP